MAEKFCKECGTELVMKELDGEGMVPFCSHCNQYRFPSFNVAVINIVVNESNGKILLIQQYGRQAYILVAGYVNKGETAEHAVAREVKEETGMTVSRMKFNRTHYYEKSNSLMCNFTAFVKDDSELCTNNEIDRYKWFTPEEAKINILDNSLAEELLLAYLDECEE